MFLFVFFVLFYLIPAGLDAVLWGKFIFNNIILHVCTGRSRVFCCWDSAWTDLRAIRRVFLFSFGFFFASLYGVRRFLFYPPYGIVVGEKEGRGKGTLGYGAVDGAVVMDGR